MYGICGVKAYKINLRPITSCKVRPVLQKKRTKHTVKINPLASQIIEI